MQISSLTGTLHVQHKATRKEYSHLLTFEDSGDIGDEYNYCPPPQDQRITSKDQPKTKIRLIEKGPVAVKLEVTTQLTVPKNVHKSRKRRSTQTTKIPIQNLITISAQSPRIDITSIYTNTAQDHRLRVLFPTHLDINSARGDTAFHITERALEPAPQEWEAQLYPMMMDYYLTSILKQPNVPGKPMGWFEDSTTTHALQTFVDVSDDSAGLLIATRGLPEYEVLNDAARTIAITLIRSVGWLSRADLTTRRGHAGPALATPGAQCLGPQIAHFSIIPYSKAGSNQSTLRHASQFVTPLRTIQLTTNISTKLPSSHGFLSINSSGYIFSCLKKAEASDSTILRIFEPSGQSAKISLCTALPIKNANLVNLAEKYLEPLSVNTTSPLNLIFPVAPFQIQTIKFQLK